MSEILKFPASENLKPFPKGVDTVLRSLGIPKPVREGIVAWARQADSEYRIPDMNLTINWPEDITDEQADLIRREIHREFARYHSALFSAKHEYIIERIRLDLTEFLRSS